MHLPQSFIAAVTGAWPVDGPAFLARLPSLIATCEARWRLRVTAPFTLSYNYVAAAVLADGSEAVLKLGVPDPEFTTEIEALRLYGGRGAVRLIDADAALGVILLERIVPGTTLAELEDDDSATAIAAEVMSRLWHPLPAGHPFPDLRRWTRSLWQYFEKWASNASSREGPLPWRLVDKAVGQLSELVAAPPEPVLIHADFHHYNVLRAEREPWLVIDPKGVASEPAFDVGPLLYNPMPQVFAWPDLPRVTKRRLDLLTERLAIDRQRLIACAFVAAMLSLCWSLEGEDGVGLQVLAIAQVLDEL